MAGLAGGMAQGLAQGRRIRQEREKLKQNAEIAKQRSKLLELQIQQMQQDPLQTLRSLFGQGQQQKSQPAPMNLPQSQPSGIGTTPTQPFSPGQQQQIQQGTFPGQGAGAGRAPAAGAGRFELPPGVRVNMPLGGGARISLGGASQGGLQDQIVRQLATDPNTGRLDPSKAIEVFKKIRTNPTGAESRIFDILFRNATNPGSVQPGELQAVEDFKSVLFGVRASKAAGTESGRQQVRGTRAFQNTERDIAAMRKLGVAAATARVEAEGFSNVREILGQIDSVTQSLITATGPGQALIQRGRLMIGAATKGNEDAAVYNDQKQAFLGVISRTLGGERGVLTDRDIVRVVDSLPDFGDTKNIRDRKIASIRKIMNAAIKAKQRVAVSVETIFPLRQQMTEVIDQENAKLERGSEDQWEKVQ